MAEAYRVFASYLRFKEVLSDPLGHLSRAGEFDSRGVHRIVWLRVLDGARVPAAGVAAAFDRAQKIVAEVQSTNVASGAEHSIDGGTPAIAFDYVPSQPLSLVFARVASEQFPIPVDNALLIVEKIALALSVTLTAEVDGERVVHGFLHPGLIFVTNDGEGIVSAFGFADELLNLVDDQSAAALIHPYLAPEVLISRIPSRRGDVYSLGAILFQLLTGSSLPVPPDDRPPALAAAHLAYDDEPLPADIKALLHRALASRPDDRFSSAADFKKELDRLLYGGAYSPTTFNLALFMDRLFRAEIETEEKERARELALDVSPYLSPVVEPEPVILPEPEPRSASRIGTGVWVGVSAVGAAVVAAVLWLTVLRAPSAPPPPPTPTAEELATQRQAQDEKMRELAQGLVAEMMAEKEAQIRTELLDRQAKIDELQRRLADSERRAQQGQLSREDQQRREDLQRQIAAEEEEQRQREAELEKERQRAEAEARQNAVAQQTDTAVAAEAAPTMIPETIQPAVSPTSPPPTAPPTAPPTRAPLLESTKAAAQKPDTAQTIVVDPSEIDTLPILIKDAEVEWPRAAQYSRRQGVVIVRATVDANGLVESVEVLRADDEDFGIPQAVMDAVKKYRFKPATKNGVRVRTYATVSKPYLFTTR
jgi:TonB family protein